MTAFTWALLAAFCWGFAPIFEKAGLRGTIDPFAGVTIRSLGVVIGLVAFLPLASRISAGLSNLPTRTWIWLCLGGFTASVVGQLCFYHALKIGDVSRVVPVGASYPILACLLGIFILKEPVTWGKASGIALVVAGTWLLR